MAPRKGRGMDPGGPHILVKWLFVWRLGGVVLPDAIVPHTKGHADVVDVIWHCFFSRFEIRGLFVQLSRKSQLIRSGLYPFRINPK